MTDELVTQYPDGVIPPGQPPIPPQPGGVQPNNQQNQEQVESQLPENLRGKTPEEIAAMFVESQKTIGRMGRELGQYKSALEQVQAQPEPQVPQYASDDDDVGPFTAGDLDVLVDARPSTMFNPNSRANRAAQAFMKDVLHMSDDQLENFTIDDAPWLVRQIDNYANSFVSQQQTQQQQFQEAYLSFVDGRQGWEQSANDPRGMNLYHQTVSMLAEEAGSPEAFEAKYPTMDDLNNAIELNINGYLNAVANAKIVASGQQTGGSKTVNRPLPGKGVAPAAPATNRPRMRLVAGVPYPVD